MRTTVLVHVLLVACAAPTPPGDAGDAGDVGDAGGRDVSLLDARDVTASAALRERVEAVMRPAFAATPASLEQCVGGAAVIVTPDAELLGGWGATTLGGSVTPDATTLFQIGSVTKVFTGLALARRVEEGAVTPETPAGDLLGADLRSALPRWPSMRALITHHAGLPGFPANLVDRNSDGRRDPGIDPRSPATGYGRSDLRATLAAWTPPTNPPYLYSNTGIGIAGLALGDQLGLANHHDLLRRLVTDDLGMRDTWGEVAAIPASARPRMATGYAIEGGARVTGIPGQMGVLASAGEIVTTASDLRLWLRALTGLERTALDGAVARATTRLADGPEGRGMGYAIEIENGVGGVRYRKAGNTSSYAAYVLWSTRPAVGVAVMTNCGGFRAVVTLAESLYDAALAARAGAVRD